MRPPEAAAPAHRFESSVRVVDTYRRLGFIAGPPSFAAVASFATLAGPADSTFVLFSMSLPANALRFQRDGDGFLAEYNVELAFVRDGGTATRSQMREAVRVATFAETSRHDESIVFQSFTAVQPGVYHVQIRASDAHSARGFRATDTLEVPAYRAAAAQLSTPIVAYQAEGRGERGAEPRIVANPRRTVSYGGAPARVYVEVYDTLAVPVHLTVRDEAGATIWRSEATVETGATGVGHAIFDVPSEELHLGRLTMHAASARETGRALPLVMTIADQWVVGGFGEVSQFLRYIATPQEIAELDAGAPEQRRASWEAFWRRRDPTPGEAGNVFRDEFFHRVRAAADSFSDGPRMGWQTDRGHVYIVLGPPDRVRERDLGRGDGGMRPTGLEWVYERSPVGRLELMFVDRTGLGRYELTPGAHAAFRNAAERLRDDGPRGHE